ACGVPPSYLSWFYYDASGTPHSFNTPITSGTGNPSAPSSSATQTAIDGSGYTLTASIASGAPAPTAFVTTRSGSIIQAPFIGSTVSPSITDSNGNQISMNSSTGVFTDTLGT